MSRRLIAAILASAAIVGCDDTETHIKATQSTVAPIVAQPEPQATPKPQTTTEQPFDFYVLALSWSPSYCATEGPDANQQQCGAKRPYGFIVHGLWPQFEKGFPSDCKTDIPRVPDDLVRSLYDIMPSAGLIGHQWRRHGSCSGLAMEEYFAKLRAARDKIAIPTDYRSPEAAQTVDPMSVEARFIEANRTLQPEAISVSCDDGYLSEIRLCMTKDLALRPCPALERRSCKAANLNMPPVGGG